METQANEVFKSFSPAHGMHKYLISVPHSGEWVPGDFSSYLHKDRKALDCDLDYRISEAIDHETLCKAGALICEARVHRVCVDLNRSEELAVLNWKFNSKSQAVVANEAKEMEKTQLLAQYYWPYYKFLESQLENSIPFIDLHSMPSLATDYHMKKNPNQKRERPDFCLSDLNGKSAEKSKIGLLQNALQDCGYRVLINDPYFGGNITKHMSKFTANAIQIETSRALYMDERAQKLIPEKIERLKTQLTRVLLDYFDSYTVVQ